MIIFWFEGLFWIVILLLGLFFCSIVIIVLIDVFILMIMGVLYSFVGVLFIFEEKLY